MCSTSRCSGILGAQDPIVTWHSTLIENQGLLEIFPGIQQISQVVDARERVGILPAWHLLSTRQRSSIRLLHLLVLPSAASATAINPKLSSDSAFSSP